MLDSVLIDAAFGAVKPWNSMDSVDCLEYRGSLGGDYSAEEQEKINFCLFNCPYPDCECCNCIAGGKKCGRGRPAKPKKVKVRFA